MRGLSVLSLFTLSRGCCTGSLVSLAVEGRHRIYSISVFWCPTSYLPQGECSEIARDTTNELVFRLKQELGYSLRKGTPILTLPSSIRWERENGTRAKHLELPRDVPEPSRRREKMLLKSQKDAQGPPQTSNHLSFILMGHLPCSRNQNIFCLSSFRRVFNQLVVITPFPWRLPSYEAWECIYYACKPGDSSHKSTHIKKTQRRKMSRWIASIVISERWDTRDFSGFPQYSVTDTYCFSTLKTVILFMSPSVQRGLLDLHWDGDSDCL